MCVCVLLFFLNKMIELRYVAMLWVPPTSNTSMAVGSDWRLSHSSKQLQITKLVISSFRTA